MGRYEEYKDSNIKWSPLIPKHWESKRAKYLFLNKKEKNLGNLEKNILSLTLKGVIRNNAEKPIGLAPNDYSTYQIFKANDLVFKLIDLENISTSRVGLVEENGAMSSAYIRFSARNSNINVKYFYFQYYDMWLRNIFNGLGGGVRQTISADELLNYNVCIPPRSEQDQIVRFLDWKVSEINRLISIQKKKIAELEELKKAIIRDKITKGLDVNVETKDSTIDWIGNIPYNWNVVKIKRLFSEDNERNINNKYELLSFSRKKGLVKFSDLNDSKPQAADLRNYRVVHKNQLLENRMQAWSGMFICVDKDGCVSPDYSVFNAKDNVCVKFYEYVFKNELWVKQFADASKGLGDGFNRLYTPQFFAINTIYPPFEEQKKIVKYLEEKLDKIDIQIKQIEHKNINLQELKTVVISDVVTGKIDVRDVVIPEYERFEEQYSNDEETSDDASEETEE